MRALLLVVLVGCGSKKEPPPEPRPPSPTCRPAPPPVTGTATHYDADGRGKCSFDPTARFVAAINSTDYAGAVWCGACLRVRGPSGVEIVVRVVDSCPGCKPGDLDLGRDAFARLAPLQRGRIEITWSLVECPVEGPIAYRFKERSNAFWTGIQVRNHRYPIASLETREKTGEYRSLRRAAYNYFVDTKGLGKGPYTLRVTDARGQKLEDSGIELGDGVVRAGSAQFPPCQ